MAEEIKTPRTKVILDNITKDKNGCWNWNRSINSRGYGLAWNGSKVVLAHRLSYELFISPPSCNLHVCHHCDNPKCVNPTHLFLGTDRDNLLDSIKKGRRKNTGPKCGQCKNAHLTPVQVKTVKHAIKTRTGSLAEVSRNLGISYYIIRDIYRGRTY